MEPTPVKSWYKKARYLVPIGTFVALWMVGSTASTPLPVTAVVPVTTQTANVIDAIPATNTPTTVTQAQPQEATQQPSEANTVSAQPQPVNTTAAKAPSQPATQTQTPASSGLSNDTYYTNSSGNEVHSPAYSNDNSIPAGASAQCRDGTYSFSQHRSGTCSHHGGVATWY